MKQCRICQQLKPLSEFRKSNQRRDGVGSYCCVCISEKERARRALHREDRAQRRRAEHAANPAYWMWYDAKRRAKRRGVPFLICKQDIVIPERCPILGVELKTGGATGTREFSPSLDAIIPSSGYVLGNIQVISHLANVMKNKATPRQLMDFANWVYRTFRGLQQHAA